MANLEENPGAKMTLLETLQFKRSETKKISTGKI